MDVTGPRYTTTAADLGSTTSLLQALTDPATPSPDQSMAPRATDFQTMTPETKSILSTIVDLLSGKFGSNFALDYQDADGNKDSIRKATLLPGVFEFESGSSDTEIAANAFGPDAEMHIVTKGGNDTVQAMANNLRIATGDGNDAVQADAAYLAAVVAGAGDDAMYLSAVTLGDVLGGDGNDAIDAWGTFVGNVRGDGGEDLLKVGGRQIWFVDGGDGDDNVSVTGESHYTFTETGTSGTGPSASVSDVGGGAGNDTITVNSSIIGSVHGDDGDDVISVTADPTNTSQVNSVDGGAGNDTITVTAIQVDSVAGGEGDDTITIQTLPEDGYFTPDRLPKPTAVEVRAGAGNDTVTVDRSADIYFGRGDGQDTMTLTKGGRIILSDDLALDPSMEINRSGSMLQISFYNGDALVLDIGTEDEMNVTMKDNIITITPIIAPAQTDEAA